MDDAPADASEDRPRYLAAKGPVDDRARNRRVEERLVEELGDCEVFTTLSVGAGLCNALDRLLSLPLSVGEYVAVDADPAVVDAARERVPRRLAAAGFEIAARDPLRVRRGDRETTVRFETADAFAFAADNRSRFDLLVGQSFVDLVGAERALTDLTAALAAGGCWYFPLTFDGGTIFQPTVDRSLDDAIERCYHEHMDRIRDGEGSSRAGRNLLDAARRRDGVTLLDAGGSDWVVRPRSTGERATSGGAYPDDEAYFLRRILGFVDDALAEHPAVDDADRERWGRRRREQVAAGELTYVAHQIDAFGRVE